MLIIQQQIHQMDNVHLILSYLIQLYKVLYNKYYQLKEQAKAMHKDEIESTYDDAIMKGRHKDGVEYYKEKFGGDK